MTGKKWLRRLTILFVCLLFYTAWRAAYARLFLDAAFSYAGTSTDAELAVEGFSEPTVYGNAVVVKFKGVRTMFYYSSDESLAPGDVVFANVRIERAEGYYRGVMLKASDKGFGLDIKRSDKLPLKYLPASWAKSIRSHIDGLFSDESAALLKGILTGDRSGFPASLTSDFSATGLSHVAAVSGLHVSILLGFIVLISGSRRRALFIGLPLIWLFVAVTGFSASAVRAGIMITMTLLAPWLGREYSAPVALGAALFILLLINPYSISDIGLQLSFLSTLGLTLFAGKLQTLILTIIPDRFPGFLSRTISSGLASSLAALVFTTPVIAYWFGSVSVIAPISNMLLLWMVTLIFITGAVAVLISYIWWPAGDVAAYIPHILLVAFRWCIGMFAKIPYARIFTTRPILVAWLVFLYGMVLLAVMGLPKRRGIAMAAAMLAVCIALDAMQTQMYGLEISVLNVGQGACMVVRSRGKTAVIDCGGNLGDVGNIAADYLESIGARSIDTLILTHLHSDHINGVPTLLDRVPVNEIFLPEEGIESEPDFLSDFSYIPLQEELTLPFGESELMLVPSLWQGGDNEVCMSVIYIKDQFSFMTTGDLSAPSERWLTRWLNLPEGGILLAGHHGSAHSTSAEYLEAAEPQAVIISVGRNTFGHPTPEVLERLEAAGSQVYRTDLNGHVVIRVP